MSLAHSDSLLEGGGRGDLPSNSRLTFDDLFFGHSLLLVRTIVNFYFNLS